MTIKYAEKKMYWLFTLQEMMQDIDFAENFRTILKTKKTEFVDNMITIGALNFEYSDKVVCTFF
jgi:hypothetical protein